MNERQHLYVQKNNELRTKNSSNRFTNVEISFHLAEKKKNLYVHNKFIHFFYSLRGHYCRDDGAYQDRIKKTWNNKTH
jgi:hypothetical protein